MNQNKTYKTIIGAFLLALYAFIATPVQIWHHHSYEQNIGTNKSESGATAINESGQPGEASCGICSHHYFVDSHEELPVFRIFITPGNPKQGFYAFAGILAPYFNSTNKGPPAKG